MDVRDRWLRRGRGGVVWFSDTEVLGGMALERMLAGLSTRRYPVALEPVGARTEKTATATSRSAVRRLDRD